MAERRKDYRVDKTVHVLFRWPAPQDHGRSIRTETTVGMTADVSSGGMRVFARNAPRVGTPIVLTVAWDTPPAAFEHRGRIVRNQATDDGLYELGIEFIHTNDKQWTLWHAFCDKTLPASPSGKPAPSYSRDADEEQDWTWI